MNKILLYPLFSLLFFFFSTASLHAQIYINEFLASNETGITDEAGNFEDWIEIFNAGNEPVNLAGYYFSDDPTEPLLWQIPAGGDPSLTTVPAEGYLIFWADKDTEDGPNHLDLKLGASGEAIILTQPDGSTTVDEVVFGSQSDDISSGRATDGADDFVFFPSPSPGSKNEATGIPTYTVNFEIPLVSGLDDGEEFPSGQVRLNSQDIEMIENLGGSTTAGLRFTNINLPPDAVINQARLKFIAEEIQTGSANLNIHGDFSGDTAPLEALNNNITQRPLTNTSINWIPEPWPVIGAEHVSPDLSDLMTEIITQSSWEAGNAITFIISGVGTRTTFSYDQSPSKSAKLLIEAEIPLPTDPIPTVYINEISANSSSHTDESGTKEDWVEIYNPNEEPVDLSGLYLSDKISDPTKWQINSGTIVPANGYLVFFTDNDEEDGPLHTNFSLKAGGEDVVLSQLLLDGLRTIDVVSYEDMPFMATYGREMDGSNNFVLFGTVTPEGTNNQGKLYLPSPTFSVASGAYENTQTVSISSSEPGTTIYYTSDGSDPDNFSSVYNGSAISVSETSSLKAIARKSGYANSLPADATYLINENKNIPILYITTDPDNFFDDETGIYVDGTNGVIAYCASEPVNWARDWERPINLKMFLPDGTLAFDVNAGVEINGACSRNRAMKSLGINLREKEFGDEAIEYPLFPERDHDFYQRLKLRNSGQDFRRLGFRDMINQNLITGKLDIDLQAGRPALLYLNGTFWGIHNIREKFAGEYFEAIYDLDEDDLDIIKSPGLPWRSERKGTDDIYNALFDIVAASNMSEEEDWNYFQSQVDVNEMMNYWITMTYMNNYDWPANNLTVWRERKEGAKWRYGMADTDGSTQNNLTSGGVAEPSYNKFAFINDPNNSEWPNHSNSTLFLRKSLDREAFRNEFIQRSCSIIELVYDESRVNTFIDEAVGQFEPNVQDHIDLWAFDNAMGGSIYSWNDWIDLYRDFYEQRPTYWRAQLNDFYSLNGYYDLTVSFHANSGGDVVVNTNEMNLPYNYVGTYFKNIPLRLKAVAKPGYEFQYWLETGDTNAEIDFVGNANTTLTPIFQFNDCNEIEPGTPCDDEDICTINDQYDTSCNCVGTFLDADEDQICAAEDCDDNNPDLPTSPGTACDDGNAQTANDTILADGCTCQGTILPPVGEYCESKGDFPWHDYITNVRINTLNNFSGKSKYSDFTNLSTNLLRSVSYEISLTASFSYTTYDEYWNVWIDYNQDGIFSESSELAFSGVLNAPSIPAEPASISGSITVPANAGFGPTRMRVSMKRGSAPTPCELFGFGEVEDYTIRITSPQSITRAASNLPKNSTDFDSEIVIFPNPADKRVNIKLEKALELIELEIFDFTGKKIETRMGKSGKDSYQLDVSTWPKGTYFVALRLAEGHRITKRFVVGAR